MTAPLIEYARRGRRMDAFPVFDLHAHVGEFLGMPVQPFAGHIAEMDRLGIRWTAVSSAFAIAGQLEAGNRAVREIVRAHPDRVFGYAVVSANYPELMETELETCFTEPGVRGIKVYQTGVPYDDLRFAPAWEFARERQAVVLAHTWGGNLSGLDRVALEHPQTPFLAAHAGSDFAYEPYLEAARRAPNLYLDLTYSREHTGMIEHLVRQVGADRIVWGTDYPLFSMAHQLSKVLFARITDDEKMNILSANAIRLFRLSP